MAQTNETTQGWTSTQAYVLALICLLVGGAIGYLLRGSASSPATVAETQPAPNATAGMGGDQMPTPEQLKMMADKQAAPLLDQLKSKPTDPALLAQAGNVYYDAHVFPVAIDYYQKALVGDPDNKGIRTDMGTAYFYAGDSDHALVELDKVLKANPTFPSALFNRGIVKWQGKMDVEGAVADWESLLKNNPDYEGRAMVLKYIAEAKKHSGMKAGKAGKTPVN